MEGEVPMRRILFATSVFWSVSSAYGGVVARGHAPPDVALTDVSTTSQTTGEILSPGAEAGHAQLWYFAGKDQEANVQMRELRGFVDALDDDGLSASVRVVLPKRYAGNIGSLDMSSGFPVLVDSIEQQAWSAWGASAGDIFLLDEHGRVRDVVNVRERDLVLAANRSELESRVESMVFGRWEAQSRSRLVVTHEASEDEASTPEQLVSVQPSS